MVAFSPCVAVERQLLDVVYQAIELPLPVDLSASSQREAVESLVVAQIAEHLLYGCESPGDHLFALGAIDSALHALGGTLRGTGHRTHENGNLSDVGSLRVAQTLGP